MILEGEKKVILKIDANILGKIFFQKNNIVEKRILLTYFSFKHLPKFCF